MQGKCLTELGIKRRKKEEAEKPVYISHFKIANLFLLFLLMGNIIKAIHKPLHGYG